MQRSFDYPAGVSLDLAVALTIFGYQRSEALKLPGYSQNIEDAMCVVDHMSKRDVVKSAIQQFRLVDSGTSRERYTASFPTRKGAIIQCDCSASGSTPAEAICRAALKALYLENQHDGKQHRAS